MQARDTQTQAGAPAGAPAPEAPAEAEGLPAEARPELDMQITPRDGVKSGELIEVRISAVAREGDDVTFPEQGFGAFELHDKQVQIEPAADGSQRFLFTLELLALEPGTHELPPLRLRVVTRDGVVGHVTSETLELKVRSRLANVPDAKPKGPTSPVRVMEDDYTLLWLLGGLLAAAAIAALTWLATRYLQRRQRAATPPPPPRPPWEVALEKLNALQRERRAMLDAGQGVELVDRASDAVREYLGASFGFDGLERTSDEMLQDLMAGGAQSALLDEVDRFLRRCDLVKFAKVEPSEDEIELVLSKAFELVRAASAPPQVVPPSSTTGQTALSSAPGGEP